MTRSEIMSRIRSKGTKPEVAVQQAASSLGIRHVRNDRSLPGTPDLFLWDLPALPFPEGIAVFMDGCFWHGCRRCYRRPKTNRKFWDAKV